MYKIENLIIDTEILRKQIEILTAKCDLLSAKIMTASKILDTPVSSYSRLIKV